MNEDQTVNPTPSEPAVAPAPVTPEDPKKNPAYGTILGIVLIVVILVVGAFYVWGARLEQERPVTGDETQGQMPEGATGSVDVDVSAPQPY